MNEPKLTALPKADFTETKSNSYAQTLAQGCLQLQADGGHIYDLLLLFSSCIVFDQPTLQPSLAQRWLLMLA